MAQWSALLALLAVASQHHCLPGHYARVSKLDPETGDWKKLEWPRVLGLGLEQVLKSLAATGDTQRAFGQGYIVFSNVRARNASPNGVLGIPIGLTERRCLVQVATALWQLFDWLGMRVIGVDVPFSHYMSPPSPAASGRFHDLVCVLEPGGLLPFAGATTVEVCLTTLPWGAEGLERKMAKAGANCRAAAAIFCLHLLVVVRIKLIGSSSFEEAGRRCYRWDGTAWVQVLHSVLAPRTFRVLGDQKRSYQAVLDALGNPFPSGARRITHVFKMVDFLRACKCKKQTDRAVAILKKKGVKGIACTLS